MKAVLRFGALAVGVALTAGGAGVAAPSRDARRGPARVGPARLSETPRIADEQREVLADRKRDEAIEGFHRLIPKLQEGSHRRADMLYRLAELYWEKSKYLYRLEMERYLSAEKAWDEARARGEKLEQPKQEHAESERYRAEAMRIYEELLRDYPGWTQRDEVLFYLGYNLLEIGRRKEAVERYLELIRDYPQSQFVPDTYVQLGNHFFDSNKLREAREHYEKARASNVPKVYAYAVYKLAWCDFNGGAYEEGLAKLHEVVDYAEQRGEELGDLKTEALNDLTLFYVQLDRAEDGIAYFKQRAGEHRQARLIARMAGGLMEAGLLESAIRTYRTLIDDAPMGSGAPEYQQAIVRAHEGLRQRAQVRKEMARMVELYRPGGAWWQANAGNLPVLRNAFDVTEEAMRVMVTEYHQEAQKTRQVETYRLARDIYKQYVDAFASQEDPEFISDSAFNMRFFYAEILWTLEEWAAAAAEYDAVVTFQIPDRDSAREVSNEKYRKTAAYSAVLAYDKLLKIERGQLEKSDLRSGQKVDERKSKGRVEKRGRLVKREVDRAEEPLSRFEARLVAACDTYNRLYPGNPDEIDLRYQSAVILYDRHHYVEAARRFGEIIQKFPSEARSRDAADLTMYVLESREEWKALNELSRQFLANKKLLRPSPEFAARVARVVEGSQYKWIHEVVYQKEKNPAKAAELFLAFVEEFPRSENAARGLTSAMVIFQEAEQLDRAASAGERVLAAYPDSIFEPKVRYTLARLYEKLARFHEAAAMYAAFVDAHDKASRSRDKSEERRALLAEAEPWVPDALFNAGLWWAGVGARDEAIGAWRAYMKRFKTREDVPRVAFNIGIVHEEDGKWLEAVRAFASFIDRYGRDARTSASQVYLARYRQFLAYQKLKDTRSVERTQRELLRSWSRLPAAERQKPELLNAYGHVRFLEVEPAWQRFVDIHFTRVATIQRDLASKQQALQRLEKAYTSVLAIGSGEWGIAALTRLGLAYADFARNVLESPDPPGLDEEQVAMYRGELQNLALPLEDKATEALEKALEKAYELSLYNTWTLAAQDQLNHYRPGSYAEVRRVPFRGSEFFVTADVVKDPGSPVGQQEEVKP